MKTKFAATFLVLTSVTYVLAAQIYSKPTTITVQNAVVSGNSALDSLPKNTWYEFPNSKMSSVAPSGVDNDPVISRWSSGAYDTDHDFLIVWGGGHGDYSGNEIYRFGPLTTSNPKWERLTNPSNPPANNSPYAGDGRPVSRHTYDLLDYLPTPFQKLISVGVGSEYSNGYSQNAVDFYDFSINGLSGQPWSRGNLPKIAGSNIFAFSRFNPVTGLLWYLPGESSNNQFQSFNPSTNTWTSYNSSYGLYNYATATIDTKRNRLLVVVQSVGILVWDLNNPNAAPTKITTTGADLTSIQAPGFVYDPVGDRIIGWTGGTPLYALSIPSTINSTWTWSTVPVSANNTLNPGAAAVAGTYGRFRYVPKYNAVIVVNSTNQSVFFRKL